MTVSKLSRRTVLSASVATVAIVAPAATLAAAAADDGSLLALETRWRTARAEKDRTYAEWRTIHDGLPAHAQGGNPVVPPDGAGGLFPLHRQGKAISLRDIRTFNEACITDDRFAWGNSPARLARIRAEGRERVRWWIAAFRDGKRLRAASGLDEAHTRDDEAYDLVAVLEGKIMRTAPEGLQGIRVKLAVLASWSLDQFSDADKKPLARDEWGSTDLGVMDLHAEAERIAGRAQA
jgi:hypothetical protein